MNTHRLPVVPAPGDEGKTGKRWTTFTVGAHDHRSVRFRFPHRVAVIGRDEVQALADYLNDWLLDTE